MNAVDQIKECLQTESDFVLQGGAGSGKTETLKEIISHISLNYPDKNLACITLTNKAAEEIKRRVVGDFHVSTIHSFLNGLVSRYQENIKTVISEIFVVPHAVYVIGKEETLEHKIYKKSYEKYSKSLYRFSKVKAPKVTGKREYDKDPKSYVLELFDKIKKLNIEIINHIEDSDFRAIKYNETPLNNIKNLSYGHDGLLAISSALLKKYNTLQRILSDRFDYLFIDEYQDTSPEIVDVLLEVVAKNCDVTIGFFGDSMQGIYKDGVGDVEKYINDGRLKKIEKEDNYRCSEQVVGFLNTLRLDTLRQEVAFKLSATGQSEVLADRQGVVTYYYAIAPATLKDDKEIYYSKIKSLISIADPDRNAKILMLTNKAIAAEVGFSRMFSVFYDRYGQDNSDQLKRVLATTQFDELYGLCRLFKEGKYNEVVNAVRRSGFLLRSQADKEKLYTGLQTIVNSKKSAMATMKDAYALNFLSQSQASLNFSEYKDIFLKEIEGNKELQDFISDYNKGITTAVMMGKAGRQMDDFLFSDLERLFLRRNFYEVFFSDLISFSEICNYLDYFNDKKPYITMHKTKGTGIDNVVVVLNEYFWNEYNFRDIFDSPVMPGFDKIPDRKLVYVACSRAIKNLSCVRLISEDEEASLLNLKKILVKKVDFNIL